MDDHQLVQLAKSIKLCGLAETLDARLGQARDNHLAYEEFLGCLLQDEQEDRQRKRLARNIKQAQFEEAKSFDNFSMDQYSNDTCQMIRHVMTGKFLKEKNHIVIMGPVGTGKTHLAQAIGLMACQKYKKVKFARANDLLQQFYRSRADETWDKLHRHYAKFDVLILDDFGLKSLPAEQSEDLYDLIANMHIHSSMIFTSNRKIESWIELFHDPVMANAAMDRIINRAIRIVLDGESYRKKFTPKISKGDNDK